MSAKDEWYGLRLIISDIGTLGILLLPINNDAKAALGITHTVVTPLIIHALSVNENMRSNRVLRAIGLRIGLPIAGGLLGYGIANLIGATNPHTGEAFGGVIIGAVLASLTGSIADYILARRPIKH